jgi:hypothetical protein
MAKRGLKEGNAQEDQTPKRKPFKKADEYEVHFPERQVDVGNGLIVKMQPMTLKHGAVYMRQIGVIRRAILMRQVPEDEKPLPPALVGDIDAIIAEQVLPMLPMCVDVDVDALPMTAIPVLVKTWLDQNMSDEHLKNYSALEDRVSELSERVRNFTEASHSLAGSAS